MPTSTHALVATTKATAVGLADPAAGCKDEFERVIHDEELQDRLDWKFSQAFNNRYAAH
jgi:hypothetical protein